MTDLRNARVLVTGAASGIGRLMALAAAERGARIIAWDINSPGLDALDDELSAKGTSVLTQVVDVSDRDSVYAAAEHTDEAIGGVDVLVLNAGVVDGKPLLEVSDEATERVIGVNVMGLYWCTKAFLPGMVERGSGHVVTIASVASITPTPGMAAYGASKHAAFGFAETLRNELRVSAPGITTSTIMPFFIDTGMFEGAGTLKIPGFETHLKAEDVSARVIRAIEHDDERVIMPRLGVAFVALRALPPRIYDFAVNLLGGMESATNLTGRALDRDTD